MSSFPTTPVQDSTLQANRQGQSSGSKKVPANRDSFAQSPTTWVGAVSDRGIRHRHNEDAMSMAALVGDVKGRQSAILVVSDGVSSVKGSQVSSIIAAENACASVMHALDQRPDLQDEDLGRVLVRSFDIANRAVITTPLPGLDNAGSCTLIVAVINDGLVTVANVGDSRCYWIGDDGSNLKLTFDDSVAQAEIEQGTPREIAEAGSHAHAITKWLGPESLDWTPQITSYRPENAGWVMVCSDGLWNYASEPDAMATVIRHACRQVPSNEPTELARWLVEWAKAQGGHDNVTVALAKMESR